MQSHQNCPRASIRTRVHKSISTVLRFLQSVSNRCNRTAPPINIGTFSLLIGLLTSLQPEVAAGKQSIIILVHGVASSGDSNSPQYAY
jgi:hypothetical protein